MMTDRLSPAGRRACAIVSELLMAATGLFMAVWGFELVRATWHQVIAEFPFLSVGLTYLPIPLGGLFLTLFVIERLTIGRPPPGWADADPVEFE
jgi:TRAP-type C4-dicarboxylate transport system permease small subunit